MKTFGSLVAIVVPALALIACAKSTPPPEAAPPPPAEAAPTAAAEPAPAPAAEAAKPPEPPPAPPEPPKTIEVPLLAKSGSKLAGKATLTETADGVRVAITLEGVKPGDHGAHVHEKGDCSAPDAASAGGHYNPHSHPHGLPAQAERHLGDLGNIVIGKDGKGSHEITIPGANLKASDPSSFVGRSIIVHEKKDDGGQPTGNAGGRIGCGEIK